ncbi:AMP-binding protein [Streptomyces sp. NPDC058735]|uniref:AMP-binding protein n=1 Tax=Streptomyces sp. NPDC058735 TaxID=3346616 RepID=UPI00368CC5C8
MTADATFRAELIRPVHELLAGHASRSPDRTAFEDARRAVTWAELDRRTARVAGHLVELGLARGASAVIHLPNRVEAVESYLAVTRAAAVGVPLDPGSTDAELARLLDDCAARLVITGAAQLSQVRRVLADRPGTLVVLVGQEGEPGFAEAAGLAEGSGETRLWEDLASSWSLRHPPRDDLGLDEPAWLLYTSGTTGRPRGVVSTQRTSLWATASCNAPLLGLSARDRVVWPMSLFHAVAHNVCVLGAVAVGASVRLTDGPAADEVLRRAAQEDATFLVGVPTMYHRMVELARSAPVAVPRLRVCMVVGSSCPQSLHEAFRSVFGLALLDSYGSTETGGAITTNLPQGPYVPGSCGVPLPGLTLRLTDPRTGEEVERGAEGEVWVSGPALMLGYHGQPEETARVLSGGWYRTGDLARQDADGYVTITGRLKELIIRGGENIHPREVEQVLVQVPGVADAAVAGVPHETLGEVPVAYVVPEAGGVDVEAVLTACRRQLSAFKLPEEIHEVAEVPRGPAGKIARRLLAGLPARPLWRRHRQDAEPASRFSSAAVGLGLDDGGHPLLSAVVELPGRDELVCTGRVTADGGDPTVLRRADGRAVLAGAALLDLVLHAAGRADCARVRDLVADEPLVLPRHGGVQLRVSVGVPGTAGTRRVTVHGRRDTHGAARRPWIRLATATVAPAPAAEPGAGPSAWPPPGARRISADRAAGLPEAARTPRAVWRRGDEVFVEVALPDWVTSPDRHALHPALPDTALTAALRVARETAADGAGPVAAVCWREVILHATGASVLRARLRRTADGRWDLEAADGAGDPVLSARAVTCAALRGEDVRAASAAQQDALFEESWHPYELPVPPVRPLRWAVAGPDAHGLRAALRSAGRPSEGHPDLPALLRAVGEGAPVPDVVVVSPAARSDADPAGAVRAAVGEALAWVRHFADPRLARTRLVVVTRNAVVTGGEPVPDVGAAAVRGLVGAAQDRAPGRFVLLDTDGGTRSRCRVEAAVACGEPRLTLRDGRALVPRAARVPAGPAAVATGRTALFAGAEAQGAAEALLSRSGGGAGPAAAGTLLTGPFAKNAADRLALDAGTAELLRWDPVDPAGTVRALLDGAPRTVLFTAAVRADGPTTDPRADVEAALRPVVDPALELVRSAPGRGLSSVVFATPAPGAAGLADAAVAAVFDVWARALRQAGVPAVSLRGPAGASDEAVDLLAAAVATGRTALTAERPDLSVPRAPGPLTATAALLRGTMGGTVRRAARDSAADPGGLRRRLAALTAAEQEAALLWLVRDRFASALGPAAAGRIPAEARTRDLGFDSLTALTARDALESATGLALPPSVVFDFPTPAGLVRHLRRELLSD